MISSTLKIAAARPIKPTFAVFSRRCGVSETVDAGMAIASFFLSTIFPLLPPVILLLR
jgi:hypothetical protein